MAEKCVCLKKRHCKLIDLDEFDVQVNCMSRRRQILDMMKLHHKGKKVLGD